MNPSTSRAMDRVLRSMERARQPRRRRFPRSALMMGLGLVLAEQILVRLVPRIWDATLPGGVDQAAHFNGLPGLIYRAALACHRNPGPPLWIIGGLTIIAILVSRLGWPFRVLVWLAAVGTILLNAAILAITLQAAMAASRLGG